MYSGPFVTAGTQSSATARTRTPKWSAYIRGEATARILGAGARLGEQRQRRRLHEPPPQRPGHQRGQGLLQGGDRLGGRCVHVRREGDAAGWIGDGYTRPTTATLRRGQSRREGSGALGDPFVKDRKGIFEFILGGEAEPKLLDVRLFDDATSLPSSGSRPRRPKRRTSRTARSVPLATRRTGPGPGAWRNGRRPRRGVEPGRGHTKDNCEMLCATHNRAKGNR